MGNVFDKIRDAIDKGEEPSESTETVQGALAKVRAEIDERFNE